MGEMNRADISVMRTVLKILLIAAGFFPPGIVSATPRLPNINTNFDIVIANSLGNGITNCATVISNAIAAASKGGNTNGLYGGTVEIPGPGIYLCGPLIFRDNVNLQIDTNAIIRLLPYGQYPGGIINPPDFITGTSITNIEISGSGAIDGQGAPWWPGYQTNTRPYTISFSKCSSVLFQNFTISNTPAQNIAIKGDNAGNVTILGIIESDPDSSIGSPPSHNTDGIDLSETNCLIQNCNISVGDDNVALGSSSGLSRDTIITNCDFGYGHGVSIGSYTSSGVSNLTVIDCRFNLTQNGLRLKSDNDRGGMVQNLSYLYLGMTNVNIPLQLNSYYEEVSTPSSVTPLEASQETVESVSSTTPIWRNIILSNITATANSGYPAVIIWSRIELPATNIVLEDSHITGYEPVEVYNASGVQFVDSQFTLPSGTSTFELFNANIIVTNSSPAENLVTFDGVTANGYANSFALYNTQASLQNTNVLGNGPLTISSSTLTVSNNLSLLPSTVLNYVLGTNAATVPVIDNLTLGGTINFTNGPGFTNGIYTLLTYGQNLIGNLPALGPIPKNDTNFNYTINTNTTGQVNLIVAAPAPSAPTGLSATASNLLIYLKWNSVSNATTYNLKRGNVSGTYPFVITGLTATNYPDSNVTNAVEYYYVVSAVNSGSESTNSLPATAAPLPSTAPTNIVFQSTSGQLELSWPQDHLGWQLQIQTNTLTHGIGTNWTTVSGSQLTNQLFVPINPANGSVFLRLFYP